MEYSVLKHQKAEMQLIAGSIARQLHYEQQSRGQILSSPSEFSSRPMTIIATALHWYYASEMLILLGDAVTLFRGITSPPLCPLHLRRWLQRK